MITFLVIGKGNMESVKSISQYHKMLSDNQPKQLVVEKNDPPKKKGKSFADHLKEQMEKLK